MSPGVERLARALEPSEAIDLAGAIADRLRHAALRHGGECTWLGSHVPAEAPPGASLAPRMRTLGGSLYDGTAGVALFLLALHRLSPRAWLPDLAREALAHARRTIAAVPPESAGGFYAGLAGVGYVSRVAGALLDDRAAMREGVACLSTSIEVCNGEGGLDLISGLSGVVVAAAADPVPAPEVREVVAAGQAALLAGAVRGPAGRWSWRLRRLPSASGSRELTGLSHGYSGIAAGLLAAHGITHDALALEGAEGAMAAEDRWFLPDRGNWCDLTQVSYEAPPSSPSARRAAPCAEAWCHGGPGIAVVRRLALDFPGVDPAFGARLAPAVRTIGRALDRWRPGADVSLCHGVLGLIECLELAAGEASRGQIATALTRVVRAHSSAPWWPSGVPSRGPTPSLLLGMAGVGYQLLRWASGGELPSVLLPTASRGRGAG